MAKFVAYFLVLSLSMAFRVATSDPILSCSQTPYPHVCSSMVSTSRQVAQAKTQSGFRSMVLHAAMDLAVQAHEVALIIDTSSLDMKAKAAWADCLKFSKDTIKQINRSMGSTSKDDVQTWLSAAMTNQQTCRNGFNDLGSSFPLGSPFLSYNISELLSNCLAINKAMTPKKSGGNPRFLSDGFPKWMSTTERKLLQSSNTNADLVVAKDGSGDYTTISEAIAAATIRSNGTSRFVIHVKAGIYNETVETSMNNLMITGDGIGATIITGNKNFHDGFPTAQTATFAVSGDGFIARDMTFQNTAGPEKEQAVAFLSSSDRSVLYQCSFEGYQDTLCALTQRQFYRNCDIYGTIDFIFGDAAAVFQQCNIYVRKPMTGQANTVTAQGRATPDENTGIIIHDSVVTAAPDLKPVQGSFQTYLGRPWREYSRTVFMKTSLDSVIDPAGWLQWNASGFYLSTLYYGEYMNTGAGANTGGRVKWPGYHVITSASEASNFTVGSFLGGDSWIPATGVPYISGL
ncbi:probable pectinesterase/pectinesterase inhibitor 17 [Elaeis guineensis]|uniref:Pectinesterase n=1 Tax=Elaeis guineensis var. tenera TaxID=51953 RepID=A0A6I9S3I2_ELAGV|nr:pectinesterase-like [Elaeis guineensis]